MKTRTESDSNAVIELHPQTVTCRQECDCGSVSFVQAEGGCDDLPVTCLDCDGE
jgi:hypothetical protein